MKTRQFALSAAVALLLSMGCIGGALAADAPKAEAGPVAMEFSIASLAAIGKQLTDLGVPLPPLFKAEMLDDAFPFLGGVDDARPCSFSMLMSNVPQANRGYFSMPAKDPSPFLKEMQQGENKPSIEGAQIYPLGPAFIRIAADRVWFGGTAAALQQADEAKTVKLYADGKTLATLWFDLTDARRNHPEILKEFVQQVRTGGNEDPAQSPAGKQGEDWGRELVCNYIQNILEHADLTLLKATGETIGVQLLVAPAPQWPGPAISFPTPALPAECAGRVDLVLSIPTSQVIKDALKPVVEKLTRKDPAHLLPFVIDLATSHLSGDANSLGWAVKDDACVCYVVRQAEAEQDVEATLKKLVADSQMIALVVKEKELLRLEEYKTAAGAKVWRETLLDNAEPVAYIDVLAKGKRVYMTISDSDKKFVEQMPLDQDVAGQPLKKGAAVQIDLAKMLDAVQKKTKQPLPPELTKAAAEIKTPLLLKCEPAAAGLQIELTLPVAAIKALMENLTK